MPEAAREPGDGEGPPGRPVRRRSLLFVVSGLATGALAAAGLRKILPDGGEPAATRIPEPALTFSTTPPPATTSVGTMPGFAVDVEAGEGPANGPVLFDGVLLASSRDTLHAIDLAGERIAWSYASGGGIQCRPTVAGQTVYQPCTSGDPEVRTGHLQALSSDGTRRWSFPTLGWAKTPVVVRDGVVFAGSHGEELERDASAGRVYAVADGEARWEARITGQVWQTVLGPRLLYVRATYGLVDGKVYAGTVTALDPADGREVWRRDYARTIHFVAVIDSGVVVLTDSTLEVLAHDDGGPRWSDDQDVVCVYPAVFGDRLLMPTRKALRCLEGATGQQVWSREWSQEIPAGFTWMTLSLGDSIVVTHDQFHGMQAFSLADGRNLWESADFAFNQLVLNWAYDGGEMLVAVPGEPARIIALDPVTGEQRARQAVSPGSGVSALGGLAVVRAPVFLTVLRAE